MDVVPWLMPAVMRLRAARRYLFRTVSQTMIEYRRSALSAGSTGRVWGGDRLPWAGDNFAPLGALEWQAHVYGSAPRPLIDACRELDLPLHVFPCSERMQRAGLARDALYVVRPDGYVGLADPAANPERLKDYVRKQFRIPARGTDGGLHSAHV
jgi:hypothetical protein